MPKLVYLRGSPEHGSAELCIAPGDHTCEVHELTLEQLKNIVADGADFIRRWEARNHVRGYSFPAGAAHVNGATE